MARPGSFAGKRCCIQCGYDFAYEQFDPVLFDATSWKCDICSKIVELYILVKKLHAMEPQRAAIVALLDVGIEIDKICCRTGEMCNGLWMPAVDSHLQVPTI